MKGLARRPSFLPSVPSWPSSVCVWGGGASRLLTNGPGVRRLRKVLGHLPVDVKPAESKGTGVRWAQRATSGTGDEVAGMPHGSGHGSPQNQLHQEGCGTRLPHCPYPCPTSLRHSSAPERTLTHISLCFLVGLSPSECRPHEGRDLVRFCPQALVWAWHITVTRQAFVE